MMKWLKRIVATAAVLLFTQLSYTVGAQPEIMPMPQSVETLSGHTAFSLFNQLTFEQVTAERQALIKSYFRPFDANNDAGKASCTLHIAVAQKTDTLVPAFNADESYRLHIKPCQISLWANTEQGMLMGVQTLRQLVYVNNGRLPLMKISDFPRFSWRGVLLDSVRHFLPLETIKRQIEGMAAAKLNVLHWHLTDDQGWRVETNSYPLLHQKASDGQFYSQEQIRELVHYAAVRGIRVVPEFDFPGHASAIAVAYPALITQLSDYEMQRQWGVFEPLLDPSNPRVYQFVEQIIVEMSGLFPDPFFHIGGDEVNPKQWQKSERVQQYMHENALADSEALHAHFNRQLNAILTRAGKQMMGWDEIFHPQLPKTVMIQSWRGHDSLKQIADAGYKGILSTGFYLDQPQYTRYHYRNDPHRHQLDSPVLEGKTTHWEFSISRLKGSAVTGEFTLTTSEDDAQVRITLNQQPVNLIGEISTRAGFTRFSLDTWMGPTRFELDLTKPALLTGRVLIGNSPYVIQGRAVDCVECQPLPMSQKQSDTTLTTNVLGGEAALWSELVNEHVIDIRLWPRLLAVAERLWSDASIADERDMYRRLAILDDYLTHEIGMLHRTQQQKGVEALTDSKEAAQALMILSEALEPAHYYTRHHVKYRADEYHQFAPLNRLVDYLPVESPSLLELNGYIERVGMDKSALHKINRVLDAWQDNIDTVRVLSTTDKSLLNYEDVTRDLAHLISIGRQLTSSCEATNNTKYQATRATLWHLARVRENETVLAAALSIESLMTQCWLAF